MSNDAPPRNSPPGVPSHVAGRRRINRWLPLAVTAVVGAGALLLSRASPSAANSSFIDSSLRADGWSVDGGIISLDLEAPTPSVAGRTLSVKLGLGGKKNSASIQQRLAISTDASKQPIVAQILLPDTAHQAMGILHAQLVVIDEQGRVSQTRPGSGGFPSTRSKRSFSQSINPGTLRKFAESRTDSGFPRPTSSRTCS